MKGTGLTLSPILCDGMVLQRDSNNCIYGTETKADTVTVHFLDSEYSAKINDDYEFNIVLPPVSAGGPYTITIKGSSEITITDILFGDVYLLSGQSNMELPIRRVLDVSGDEISKTFEPTIRQYLIPATYNFSEPEKYMCDSAWKKAIGEDLMEFSAAGYFFAKEVKETYEVPIGLIMTAVGGSTIEAWMNPVTLRRFGDYDRIVENFKNIDDLYSLIHKQQEEADNWSYRIEEGEQKCLISEDYSNWNTCIVPSLCSDYSKENFQGFVYLRREVVLEQEPEIDDAYIYMGSIIDSDQIWINGILVGRTEYRYPPRKYSIAKGILKKGSNLITVRIVINNNNGGTVKGMPYHLSYNGVKINLEGKWYYQVGKKAENARPQVLFPPLLPICFYNTVVVPLSKIAMKGVLWYQGESNTGSPGDYADKFAAMILDWRSLFGRQIPFIYVQLSNYRDSLNTVEDTGWAEIREQQRRSLTLENVAMVVTFDIGESSDLHPQNKKEVGVRLYKAARGLLYHETCKDSGPLPEYSEKEGRKVKIFFRNLEDIEKEELLNLFEVAGKDGKYHCATAIRKGACVTISSNRVELPTSVRYSWCDNPVNINFFNAAGFPASGFRMEI